MLQNEGGEKLRKGKLDWTGEFYGCEGFWDGKRGAVLEVFVYAKMTLEIYVERDGYASVAEKICYYNSILVFNNWSISL